MIQAHTFLQKALSKNQATMLIAGAGALAVLAVAGLVVDRADPMLAGIGVRSFKVALATASALVVTTLGWIAMRAASISTADRHRLATREDLLGIAHRYARQGCWEFDAANGLFTLSDALHRLLGGPGGPLQLSVAALTAMVNPADRGKLATVLERMLGEGRPQPVEHRITGFDGQERTFWTVGVRLPGSGGPPATAFGISQDISGSRAVEAALRESEEHYRHAVELSPLISWVEDADGNTLELSPRWYELTGNPTEDSLGTGWTASLHPDDTAITNELWQKALRSGQAYEVEHRVRVADGTYRWFQSRAAARRNEQGEIIRWYGTVEDIHARKLADIALRQSEAFATSILESTPDCVEVVDLNGRLRFMNRSGYKLMEGAGHEPYPGQDWLELWPKQVRPQVHQALAAAKAGTVGRFTCNGPVVNGVPGFWDISLQPILDAVGLPERLLCISRNITAIKAAQNELESAREAAEHAARHDSLTGLPNRADFRESLARRLADPAAEGQMAVLFLDLDEFKSVNDALGHPAGDKLLCEVADRLQACLQDPDQAARFGGDEFAVLQAKVEHPDQVDSLARRIIARLSEPYVLDDQQVVVGTSIGIAIAGDGTLVADELLKRADIALYTAKAAGRGLHRVFEPDMEAAAEQDRRLRAELDEALSKGEFCLHYQPILDLETSRVRGFEALLRWQHPRHGLVSPDDFIAVAETTGAILGIGEWVMHQACSMASTWPLDVSISVNLSPRQFRAQGLVSTVAAALSHSGLPPERLELEITESSLLQDDPSVRQTIESLFALGVRISIDDFGTGYSSLGYLRRFSVDNIKIDRSFVADLSSNPRTAAIIQSVVALGKELGTTLTAEGIETPWQMEQLKAMGCGQGQGYLFSRPMPAEAVDRFILRNRACDRVLAPSTATAGPTPSWAA